LSVLYLVPGKVLTEISDPAEDSGKTHVSPVLDLDVTGDTLIVPRYDDKKVLFYRID